MPGLGNRGAFEQRMPLYPGKYNLGTWLLYLSCHSLCLAVHHCANLNMHLYRSDHRFPDKQHKAMDRAASEYGKRLPSEGPRAEPASPY